MSKSSREKKTKRSPKKKLNYKVLKSGSSGNCVIIEDMIFDIGVTYRHLEKYLDKIKYLFITHRHSDHIKRTTLERIRKNYPRIKVIGNYDIHQRYYTDLLIGDATVIDLGDRVVKSFPCIHDVPCHGFVVEFKSGPSFIYATDTFTLEMAPNQKFDYLFIESNHDEQKIRAIQNTAKKLYGYDAWENAMRHLSTQKSKAFYYLHRKSSKSEWIELHKSGRFY